MSWVKAYMTFFISRNEASASYYSSTCSTRFCKQMWGQDLDQVIHSNNFKSHAQRPCRRHLSCSTGSSWTAFNCEPISNELKWDGLSVLAPAGGFLASTMSSTTHNIWHAAKRFLPMDCARAWSKPLPNKWRPGVPTTRCCPSRSLSLSSWMDVPGLSHTVTMNVPSNVVGGFGTSCCVISLPRANVAITFPNSPNLCFLLQTPAMAKHAHVLHHLHVRSVVHTKPYKTSL